MGISFAFETDIKVGGMPAFVFYQFYQPFGDIPYIKEQVEHFFHLDGMYQFVVDIELI